MTFDELKFTGRETFKAHRESEDLVIPGQTDSWDALAIILNRILAEKLATAPEVRMNPITGDWHLHDPYPQDKRLIRRRQSHTARLVCVEGIEK